VPVRGTYTLIAYFVAIVDISLLLALQRILALQRSARICGNALPIDRVPAPAAALWGVSMVAMEYGIASPGPASTIEPLSTLRYTLKSAISDLVNNSIDAGAGTIDLDFHRNDRASYISVADDDKGMVEAELQTAIAIAARGPHTSRSAAELGCLFRHGAENRELLTGVATVSLDTVGEERAAERSGLGPRARRQFQRVVTHARLTRPGRGALHRCQRSCQIQARSCCGKGCLVDLLSRWLLLAVSEGVMRSAGRNS
jgi:hypothetical protein